MRKTKIKLVFFFFIWALGTFLCFYWFDWKLYGVVFLLLFANNFQLGNLDKIKEKRIEELQNSLKTLQEQYKKQ